MPRVNLKDIKAPVFDIALPDGTPKEYDLYELVERIQAESKKAEGDLAQVAVGLRAAFDLPDASRAHLFYLQAEALAAYSELPESKKLKGLSQG